MKDVVKKARQTSGQFGAAWAEWVLKYRWAVLGLSLVLVMALASGASKLGFDADYRVFFKKDNPQLVAYEALQKKYTQDDNVLIVIESEDGKMFTPNPSQATEELTTASWQVPYSRRVAAVTHFQHTAAEGDDV